jgi:catalase (peroxidase I)
MKNSVDNQSAVADLVALGTVMSNNLCGGNNFPYRSGRVDAIAAGSTTGVPAPETSLDETLMFFERAGFDAVDAIGLTACGHTLGSVHHVSTTARICVQIANKWDVGWLSHCRRFFSCNT